MHPGQQVKTTPLIHSLKTGRDIWKQQQPTCTCKHWNHILKREAILSGPIIFSFKYMHMDTLRTKQASCLQTVLPAGQNLTICKAPWPWTEHACNYCPSQSTPVSFNESTWGHCHTRLSHIYICLLWQPKVAVWHTRYMLPIVMH